MKKYPVFYIALFMAISWLFLVQCHKNKNIPECVIPEVVPYQPYSDPVWHPNGELLGFNHTPQTGVYAQGTPPCVWYMNGINQDSAGFYLMNKDGTGFRRVTSFYLGSPSWSPDGHWIAFSEGPAIYKMHFDDYTFDTTSIIQLTDSAANFYPCWTTNSDTIFYDSDKDTPVGTDFFSIWKMASDGSGKTRLTQSAGIGDSRQPNIGSNNRVYYMSYASGKQEIFSISKDGTDILQETTNSGGGSLPKYYQGEIFFVSTGIKVVQLMSGTISLLISPAVSYDISTTGEIIYSKWDYSVSTNDKQRGCLWIMNADGSNNRQLTFNNN